jgi:uncharacterized Ntn-hydrolase superfamily protein
MTFSLVARCPRSNQFGVAAATAVPAVGKLLTWARPEVGAIATQSWINPLLGLDALEALTSGMSAQAALEKVLAKDPRRELRQLSLVDGAGRVAAFTGEKCDEWAGHLEGEGYVAAGNILVGKEVLDAMCETFEAHSGEALARRLLLSLEAGEARGGDRRGCRSATIYVMDDQPYPLWDLRVDEAEDPFAELHRLYEVFEREVVSAIRHMAKRGPTPEAGYRLEDPECQA